MRALLQDEPKKRAGGKRKQKDGAEQVGSADQGWCSGSCFV